MYRLSRVSIFPIFVCLLPLSSAALVCPGYKVDPLKIVKPGLAIRITGGATGCLTLEAYNEYLESIYSGRTAKAAELQNLHVCYNAPKEGVVARVLKIAKSKQGCAIEVFIESDPLAAKSWTDIGMIDEIMIPK